MSAPPTTEFVPADELPTPTTEPQPIGSGATDDPALAPDTTAPLVVEPVSYDLPETGGTLNVAGAALVLVLAGAVLVWVARRWRRRARPCPHCSASGQCAWPTVHGVKP